MTATVLDGKAYAKQMEAELAERVAKLKQDSGRTPIWQQFWWVMTLPLPLMSK